LPGFIFSVAAASQLGAVVRQMTLKKPIKSSDLFIGKPHKNWVKVRFIN
jgi:hypothetical protein